MKDYNQFANTYAEQTEKNEKEQRRHFYSLITVSLKGKKVLDVGCGSGHDAEHYALQGAQVYGIDISEVEIEMAKQKPALQSMQNNFIVGSLNALPYESNTFDLVTGWYAAQNAEDGSVAIEEMIRVAKPGAEILLATKHPTRNLIEGFVNDGNGDYYAKRMVTSYIFERSIKLKEPGHTVMEYLSEEVLSQARLNKCDERSDFPASEQVIPGLMYPTYFIMRFKKDL